MIPRSILAQLAAEAAASAKAISEPGFQPSAEDAYQFLRDLYFAEDRPEWELLPTEMPEGFRQIYQKEMKCA